MGAPWLPGLQGQIRSPSPRLTNVAWKDEDSLGIRDVLRALERRSDHESRTRPTPPMRTRR